MMFGYFQFSICSLYFGQAKSDTMKIFSVTIIQDYPQQKYHPPQNPRKIYNNKLRGRDILFIVVTRPGKCWLWYLLPMLDKFKLLGCYPQVRVMLFIGAVTIYFFQVLIVIFPSGIQQFKPNRHSKRPNSNEKYGLYFNCLRILH